MAKPTCRLRKFRKSAHLSQRELAFLLGLRSQGTLSEIEAGHKRPGAAVVFACEIVFDTAACDLFPGLYAHCKRTVRIAAHKPLSVRSSYRRLEARDFVAEVASRLSTASRS